MHQLEYKGKEEMNLFSFHPLRFMRLLQEAYHS